MELDIHGRVKGLDKWFYIITGVPLILIAVIIISYEYKIRKFSRKLGKTLDNIISGEQINYLITKETLEDKLNHKLKRLSEMTENIAAQAQKEKDELKSLLGDISHQIKTPIANIKMYNNILIEREVSKEKQQEFLKLSNLQIEKLDFLMQSMIKMSRLENGVIQLQPDKQFVIPTIANVLSEINEKVERKDIDIHVQCNENITAFFDARWTEEAIFNVLDNAVKYTNDKGEIVIEVEKLEMYIAIHISDNGIGISEEEQALIFKRFYRSVRVRDEEGVGIGLALTREIISKQQGFIKVKSIIQQGTTFSIYLQKSNLSKS